MCKCTYTVVVALQSCIALLPSILAPPAPSLHLYFFLPVLGIGKAVCQKMQKILHYNTANQAQYVPWSRK